MNLEVIDTFIANWSGYLAADIAEELTCNEVEALADVFRMFDREDLAGEWIAAHSTGDEEGEEHYIPA